MPIRANMESQILADIENSVSVDPGNSTARVNLFSNS